MKKLLSIALPICLLALAACTSVETAAGGEGAACYPNGTCDAGLVCSGGVCASPGTDGGVDGGGGSGGTSGTGGTGGTGGACSGDYGLEPEFFAECAAESCCPELDSCVADETCGACLASPTVECETNSLFTQLTGCLDAACPTTVCGTDVGFFGVNDPIACNTCIDANCCVPFVECLGGEGSPDFLACTSCIDDPSGAECLSAPPATQAAAGESVTCQDTSCAVPCELIEE